MPVDGASIAVVRIGLGVIGVVSVARLVSNGWVGSLLVDPAQHFRYPGLAWVPVPPTAAVWALVAVVAIAAATTALGWHTRASILTYLVAFTWLELIEATLYLNHYWFLSCALAVMAALPAGATWSIDARRRRRGGGGREQVPVAAVWLVRAQVGVVYVFAGVAKLHGDWLAHGLPLGLWLPARSDLPLIGPLLAHPETALIASWAGAAFDCTVVALLCWRRTRPAAWAAALVFHAVTWWLFPTIGVFPFLMAAAATVFFEPDWPRTLLARLGVGPASADATAEVSPPRTPAPMSTRWVALATLWCLLQIALPLWHLAYPSDARWSGEGFRFAWNVMAVERSGDVRFTITDDSGEMRRVDGRSIATEAQWRVLATDPELIRQAAHELARRERTAGATGVEVRAEAWVSLNGRPAALLIDPEVFSPIGRMEVPSGYCRTEDRFQMPRP